MFLTGHEDASRKPNDSHITHIQILNKVCHVLFSFPFSDRCMRFSYTNLTVHVSSVYSLEILSKEN